MKKKQRTSNPREVGDKSEPKSPESRVEMKPRPRGMHPASWNCQEDDFGHARAGKMKFRSLKPSEFNSETKEATPIRNTAKPELEQSKVKSDPTITSTTSKMTWEKRIHQQRVKGSGEKAKQSWLENCRKVQLTADPESIRLANRFALILHRSRYLLHLMSFEPPCHSINVKNVWSHQKRTLVISFAFM